MIWGHIPNAHVIAARQGPYDSKRDYRRERAPAHTSVRVGKVRKETEEVADAQFKIVLKAETSANAKRNK